MGHDCLIFLLSTYSTGGNDRLPIPAVTIKNGRGLAREKLGSCPPHKVELEGAGQWEIAAFVWRGAVFQDSEVFTVFQGRLTVA